MRKHTLFWNESKLSYNCLLISLYIKGITIKQVILLNYLSILPTLVHIAFPDHHLGSWKCAFCESPFRNVISCLAYLLCEKHWSPYRGHQVCTYSSRAQLGSGEKHIHIYMGSALCSALKECAMEFQSRIRRILVRHHARLGWKDKKFCRGNIVDTHSNAHKYKVWWEENLYSDFTEGGGNDT